MTPEELSELSDQELLVEAKKMKSSAIIYAFFIGFLIGIVIFSLWMNSIGFFTLIPLYFAYKLFTNSEYKKAEEAMKEALNERNLK